MQETDGDEVEALRDEDISTGHKPQPHFGVLSSDTIREPSGYIFA